MKKMVFISLTIILAASWSFAADFSPTLLTLTAPEAIQYDFDGTELSIPFTVAGTPAAVWLVINTNGKADQISGVRNGYLGWHYVNKIDTTIYVSGRADKSPGTTTIVWDGNNQDGNAVPEDTYSYYLWAYDAVTPRVLATDYVQTGHGWDAQYTFMHEKGEDGLLLSKPLLMGVEAHWSIVFNVDNYEPLWFDVIQGTVFKWTLGSDPNDSQFYQRTLLPGFEEGHANDVGGFVAGGPVFNPSDYSTFYVNEVNIDAKTSTMSKWAWITDGQAIRDEGWLGWDELSWEENGMLIGHWSQKNASITDGNYIYTLVPGLHQKEIAWNKLRCVSFEGEVIFDKMLNDWFYPDDPNPHAYINGSPHNLDMINPYEMLVVSHTACLMQMISTERLVEDADDETDMVMWENRNGDYFMDAAYEPDVEPAWYCLADDKTIAMRRAAVSIDENGFSLITTGFYGLVSLGVATQDGTGIADMSFSDDTISNDIYEKFGGVVADGGTNFDGLYIDNTSNVWTGLHPSKPAVDKTAKISDSERARTWFVAFDSVGGIISKEGVAPAVEEAAQAAFAVAQNSPNPFNPTTSISFTIPGADHVTVDIYNVAGQKVDTLVNDFMDAGTHSVVWNASGFSNGVYFYTVKSGDFSKTIKMTLLK